MTASGDPVERLGNDPSTGSPAGTRSEKPRNRLAGRRVQCLDIPVSARSRRSVLS